MMRAAAFLCFFAGPVAAQDVIFDPAPTITCMARNGGDVQACSGTAAETCMERTPFGWSTVAMMGCLGQELGYWDKRLNLAYQAAQRTARRADLDASEFAASQVDALRDMQRAWIVFRDRKCAFVQSQWGGGTGGAPAAVSCHMHETAAQTVFLETTGLGE